ncbi:MAG: NAD kinase [Sideroxydans sp.]|nr:NAD kinase [Sideroxydans sp.]
MKFPFQTVALIGKYKTPGITEPLLRLAGFLTEKGLSVVVDKLTSDHLERHDYSEAELDEMGGAVDLAIVLGGDGTMLNIVRTLAPHRVPLVGVNQGRIGFLTDISLDNMLPTIGDILEGKFVTEQRMLLQGSVLRNGVEVFKALAFNEVVLHRGNTSSMIEFEVNIDNEYLSTQRADGLIAATPTGTTAYALSAGGPIVHPALDLITLVPVSPHTLSNRPIVLASKSVLEIAMNRAGDVWLHCDSHSSFQLEENDKVVIGRYAEPACLLHPVGHSYYHTLREKLFWNKAP